MLNQILRFLLDTVFGFFVFVLLVRFYLQLMRAPFRNPLGQFVTALTNWLCLLYTSPSPRDGLLSRMPSSA